MSTVVVVGGGIAGLAAAHAVAAAGTGAAVTLREGSSRLGGHLSSAPFAGREAVDESADAFLVRVPFAVELAAAVGLDDDHLVAPAAQRAAIWHDGLHDLPRQVLGVPAGVRSVLRTRLLPWHSKLRVLREPLTARTDAHDSIGDLVRSRMGDVVHDRLVDALVGSIYAADTDRLSLSMVAQLAALSKQRKSLFLAARATVRASAAQHRDAPVFLAPRAGMAALATAVATRSQQLGVTIATGRPVEVIARDGAAWRVDDERADAVIAACPAAAAAVSLSDAVPGVATLLSSVEAADVAMLTVSVDGANWPDRLRGRSGYLVPKSRQGLVTAVSFASQKWAHLADGATELLRLSIGRDGAPVPDVDDAVLVERAVAEVGRHVGVDLHVADAKVSRWPRAFPQYRPGHRTWLEALEQACPPGLSLAGASYHGIGVPTCIDSGQRAATTTLSRLGSAAR